MKESTALHLTILLAALLVIAALLGLFFNQSYNDPEWMRGQWFGQDMITLFVAVPILLISAQHGLNNNISAWRMAFIAVLIHTTYVYAIYVFVAGFSPFYFIHLPIFGLSLFILLSCLGCFFISRRKLLLPSQPVRRLAMLFLAVVAGLSLWLSMSELISHSLMDDLAAGAPVGAPMLMSVTFDLAVIIPLILIAIVGLGRRTTRGIAWTGIMLVKLTFNGFIYMTVAGTFYVWGLPTDPLLVTLWSLVGIIGLVLTIVVLNNMQDALPGEAPR